MRRIERPPRVIYVERWLGWSMLFFGASLTVLVFAGFISSHDRTELGMALYYCIPLLLAALALLIRGRALAIDLRERKLLVLDRRLFRRTIPRVYPLGTLSVRLVTTAVRAATPLGAKVLHYIWIDVVGSPSLLFLGNRTEPPPLAEAERLAADLGRPLTVVDRTRG